MSEKLTIELMREIAQQRGGECLATEYKGWDDPLRWRCAKGHEWTNRAGKIKSGQWCPECAGKAPKGLPYLHELAAEKGGECLSTVYPGVHGHATWRCAKGHEWQAKPSNVRNGNWCPHCAGKRQTIEDMRQLAASRGGECLSEEYRTQTQKLTWRCADNHTWQAVPNSIKNGSWCPFCSINYGEEICRIYFEALFGCRFPKTRPRFLWTGPRGVMELDGYCEELGLAFEHHGEQHYRQVPRFHRTPADFEEQQRRDADKLARCAAAGVRIIEIPSIPSLTPVEKLPEVVAAQLQALGITPPFAPELVKLDLSRIYDKSALERLRDIAHSRGGELLSDSYLGDKGLLRWRCANGHEWLANPNGIKGGQWCAQCYGNVRKTLDEIREQVAKRGFTVLSAQYGGAQEKLRWRCAKGHEWEATPVKVLGSEATGCPRCAGNERKTIEDMKALAAERNGECLSEAYQNLQTTMKWRCALGHEFEMTPAHVGKFTTDWCPVCRLEARRAGRAASRMPALEATVLQKGGRIVSGTYTDPHCKFTFECAQGHQWSTSYDAVMRGTWCKQCYEAGRRRP